MNSGQKSELILLLSYPKLPASQKQLCAAGIAMLATAKTLVLSYFMLDLLDTLEHSKSKKSEASHMHGAQITYSTVLVRSGFLSRISSR